MPQQGRFRAQIEHQREPDNFQLAELFEHIPRGLDDLRLIFADFADDARVVLLGNPEKRADRRYCLLRRDAREIVRRA